MYEVWLTDDHDGVVEKIKLLGAATGMIGAIKLACHIGLANLEIWHSNCWLSGLRDAGGRWIAKGGVR